MISVAIFLGVYIHNGIIDLWICWGYSRAVFLRPGVALRYTPGCVLAPLRYPCFGKHRQLILE